MLAPMRGPAALLLLAVSGTSVLSACGGDKGTKSDDDTELTTSSTPSQILSNPYVESALEEADDAGLSITPERGVSPPVISGTYSFTGEAMSPEVSSSWHSLQSGTWTWWDQTSNNSIKSSYSQIGVQTGTGPGAIIRGTSNKFTVYSVMEVTTASTYTQTCVLLIDGMQDTDGNVTADYVITPTERPQGPYTVTLTVGRLSMALTTGTARHARGDVVDQAQGVSLAMLRN